MFTQPTEPEERKTIMEIEVGQVVQQGEVRIKRMAEAPSSTETLPRREMDNEKGYILSHSENGNHHILDGGEVIERPARVEGLDMFYAILDEPQSLIQDAPNKPHGKYDLPAGFYDIRISREYNPFMQEARRVAD